MHLRRSRPRFPVVAASVLLLIHLAGFTPQTLAQSDRDSAAARRAAALAKSRAAAGGGPAGSKPASPARPKTNAAATGTKTKTGQASAAAGKASTTSGGATKKSEQDSTAIRAREAQIAELINDPPAVAANVSSNSSSAKSNSSPIDPNAPVVVTSKSELTPLDQLDLETLELLAKWLNTIPDESAARAADLDSFMTRSRTFLKRRPDEMRPWLLRARLALSTGRVAEGTEAAENLKRLGAVASSDERTHRMMLALDLKGWLQAEANPNPELSRTLASAELGDSKAQARLGQMFGTGSGGVAKDPAEALRWSLKAAASGDSDGQLNLALMFRNGSGVPKDEAQALVWYRKAARQGNVVAQETLKQRSLSW